MHARLLPHRHAYSFHCLRSAFLLISGLFLITAQSDESSNPCLTKETCSECVTSNSKCGWCTKEKFNHRRCDLVPHHIENGCGDQTYFPNHEGRTIQDDEMSNKTGPGDDPIQMKPQRIQLRLRPNSPYIANVQFRQALDYPVGELRSAVWIKKDQSRLLDVL